MIGDRASGGHEGEWTGDKVFFILPIKWCILVYFSYYFAQSSGLMYGLNAEEGEA